MFEYTIIFLSNTAAWNSGVAEVQNSVNSFLEGFPDKIKVRSESPICTKITSPIKLPHDKLVEFGKAAAKTYNEQPTFKGWDFTYERYTLAITSEKAG